MDPKTLFLLAFVIYRMDRAFRAEKTVWIADHDSRKFKSHHNTSLFLSLQSTDPVLTNLCLKPKFGWCEKMDDVFVVPYQYINWHKHTDPWLISHFSKMLRHSERLPQQAAWYMFAFDDNYVFVEKLIGQLAQLDSHLPIYMVLKDREAEYHNKPILIFSRYALNSFYYQEKEKCDENLNNLEDWLTSCMTVPPLNISVDKYNKSRIFAMERHFMPDEMAQRKLATGGKYDDGEKFISSHSSSLLAFTNLNEIDLKLLPILLEKIRKFSDK